MNVIFVYILLSYYFPLGKKRSLDDRIDGILAKRFKGRDVTMLKLSDEVERLQELVVKQNRIITQLKEVAVLRNLRVRSLEERVIVLEHSLEMSENSRERAASLAESLQTALTIPNLPLCDSPSLPPWDSNLFATPSP